MRVLCLGNMNNNFFSLVRYLRDRGHDAHLMPQGYEPAHFDPSCDAGDDSHQTFMRRLDWPEPPSFTGLDLAAFRAMASSYDFVIGCGFAPALMHEAGLRLDLFLPYGSDLYEVAFPGHPAYARIQEAQAQGIRRARFVSYGSWPPHLESLKRLGCAGEILNLVIPMVYTPSYDPARLRAGCRDTELGDRVLALREESDLLVVHPTRHVWKTASDPASMKGNDILVRGLRELIDARPDTRPGLALFEYGPDVEETRRLVESLGLRDRVAWFPTLPRRQVMAIMAHADAVATLFVVGGLICGSMSEGLLMGKPLLGFREDHKHRGQFPTIYEIMNAGTPEQVRDRLCEWYDDPQRHRAMGEAGRRWLMENIIDMALDTIEGLMRGERMGAAGLAAAGTSG